jgi:glycosyltransferase involved in cell wall biosynthesis
VIPCLNEARFVGALVHALQQHLPIVVVVDDGSNDETSVRAAEAGAAVLRHPHPHGKGAALKTGVQWLRDRGFSWALLMDGDGQHAPEDAPKFLAEAERAPVGLIVGNRMINPQNMPILRRWTNRGMSWLVSRLSTGGIPDSQCGYRLVNVTLWSQLNLQSSHFEIESEVLVEALRAGQGVRSVPITVRYGSERTKISVVRDSCRWFRWWWNARHQSGRAASVMAPPRPPLTPPHLQPPVDSTRAERGDTLQKLLQSQPPSSNLAL